MADIIGPTAVHDNTVEGYSTDPQTYVIYNWAVIGGNIVYGQNTPAVIIEWTTSGTNTLTCHMDDGRGEVNDIVITVDVSAQGGKPHDDETR